MSRIAVPGNDGFQFELVALTLCTLNGPVQEVVYYRATATDVCRFKLCMPQGVEPARALNYLNQLQYKDNDSRVLYLTPKYQKLYEKTVNAHW